MQTHIYATRDLVPHCPVSPPMFGGRPGSLEVHDGDTVIALPHDGESKSS